MRDKPVNRTEASLAANFVADAIEAGRDWEAELLARGIRTNREGQLANLCYGKDDPDFSDPLVRACRGIILEVSEQSVKVVCWPFDKFANSFEPYAATIDWKSAHAEDKLDGSIVKLYHYDGEWTWATNRMPLAAHTDCNGYMTYLDAIMEADNYADVMSADKDESLTYMFELTGPRNKIVVRYDTAHLTHIGTRSNVSGQELSVNIGIDQPRRRLVSSLEGICEMADQLNPDEEVTDEGFVVVDKDWHRIKVKSERYAMMHYLISTAGVSRRRAAAILVSQDEEALHIIEQDQMLARDFAVFRQEYEAVVSSLDEDARLAKDTLDELRATTDERTVNAEFAKIAKTRAKDISIWFHVKKHGYQGPRELAAQIYERSNRGFVERMRRTGSESR